MSEQKMTGYPSIDKPWLKYYSSGFMDEIRVGRTVYQYISENNSDYMKTTALKYKGINISYEKMMKNVDKIANAMVSMGLKVGDTIMIASTGTPETVYVLLACSKLGICAEMINFSLDTVSIKNHIQNSTAKVAFCLDRIYEKIKIVFIQKEIDIIIIPATQSLPSVVRVVDGMAHRINKKECNIISYSKFLSNSQVENANAVDENNQSYIVVYTSGTTGIPKGIVHTNRSYTSMAEQYRLCEYSFERGDCFLNQIPFFIASGLSYLLMAALMVGVTVILEPEYDVNVWINDIKKYRPEVITATQSFFDTVSESDESIKKLDFVKMCISGGEPVSEKAEERVNKWLLNNGSVARLIVGWGMSELNGTVTTSSEKYHKPGTTGIPLPDIIVGTFDSNTGEELTYNSLGELMVNSPCAMKKYVDETIPFWWTDIKGRVWARTGDVGMIDEDGEIHIKGRASESIFLNDRTIYFFELEETILKIDCVDKCKIVLQAEKILNINLTVLSKDNENIEKMISENLYNMYGIENKEIKYKIWDEFPLNANGKVDKNRLREV